MAEMSDYIGRFAPSPSGPLHLGSLVAALGSWLEARANNGLWLLRIEDIDPPREVPGAADDILKTLDRFGLVSDRPVLYQSSRHEAYRAALDQLSEQGTTFPCACTRKDLPENGVYPGTCRGGIPAHKKARTIRFNVGTSAPLRFEDRVMGSVSQDLQAEVGDFVLRRADGLASYQLAVVVDDAYQRITDVVRGADLLDSTARQIALQRRLDLQQPGYCHLPLVVDREGRKLSKRLAADPLGGPDERAVERVLRILGHEPPDELSGAPVNELLRWAQANWRCEKIPSETSVLTAS